MGTYLKRTFSADNTSRTTFTLSFWVKRTSFGSVKCPISAETNNNDYDQITFASSDQFDVNNVAGGSDVISFKTSMKFSDPSAWYHIVIAIDTTQASSSNGIKIYVNGVLQTSFASSTYAQNATFEIGRNGSATSIGRRERDGDAFGIGYLADFFYIDGQQKAATDFGQTDSTTGIWKPKSYSGTYGNNGFNLEFKNAAALGTDTSGNSETFTVNAAGTGAQVVDTPSNNFAIINPSAITNADSVLTLGGTVHTVKNGNAWIGAYTTLGATKGKWYSEVKVIDVENTSFGVIQSGGDTAANINNDNNGYIGKYADGWGWWGNGSSAQTVNNNNNVNYGTAVSVNDIYMIAVDITGGKIWMGKNGTWFNGPGTSYAGNPANGNYPGFTGITFTDFVHFASGNEAASGDNAAVSWNFGNASFSISSNSGNGYADANNFGKFQYTVPSGYYSLCTKNLNTYG